MTFKSAFLKPFIRYLFATSILLSKSLYWKQIIQVNIPSLLKTMGGAVRLSFTECFQITQISPGCRFYATGIQIDRSSMENS